MKATKKIVGLTLAIVMAALVFIMPVSAAEAASLPFIMVNGFASSTLYKNLGEEYEEDADGNVVNEGEMPVFSSDEAFLEGMIKDVGGALLSGIIRFGIANKDYDTLADNVFPAVNEYLEDIGYNIDGTPRNATVGVKQLTKPISEYTEEELTELTDISEAYIEKFGAENAFNFTYDWREDPVVVAAQLDAFIKEVAGEGKVNMIAMSMGSAVTLAYINEYSSKQINNLVFASPAWQGTELMGDIMTGNIEIDVFAVENFLVQLANVSATTHIAAFIISFIASWDGLSREYFGDIDKALQGILPRAYTDTIIPYLAGMPGFWSLVPYEYYDAAKEFIFDYHGIKIDPAFEAKIDYYHEIQGELYDYTNPEERGNAAEIIDEAIEDGMRFYIVGGYNCQMYPINDKYESSDTVIDVKHMTGGATCAKYLQAGDDWGKVPKQVVEDGHRHLSWDSKVDLSTAVFPDQTWLIKNMQHNGLNSEDGTMDLVLQLLMSDEQLYVYSDKENYPQFMLYNTYTRTTRPVAFDALMGDTNDTQVVRTDDALLGLKMSAGVTKTTDHALAVGDIDEDGKLTTDDVIVILQIAAGIAEY